MRVLALIWLCFAAVAAVPTNHQRIVGGDLANINQYPSIAALLYSWNLNHYAHACGGIILNTNTILTAAHCTYGDAPNSWRIRVGSSMAHTGGNVYNVAHNIVHNAFSFRTLDNDIAILRSSSVFANNDNVRVASIAGPNYLLADHSLVWAVGWGDTYFGSHAGSEQLRHVQVQTINQNTCRINYATRGVVITDNMLCSGWPTGSRDQCHGDSGGPLYHNNIVVGVCSFGIGCGQAFFPRVNTRVSRYTAWIIANS
ncbi:trypsin CFT-1-like [Spodoptera frugiperda]|uniref:Trypsin CFT-1-like n=1 Tax=Spodoptera frugiperda TaxID=7108 RepID=A0A9R0ENT3_SPOFR|nr:trypsin CFT-1-like [Spodoptera frugiperda]